MSAEYDQMGVAEVPPDVPDLREIFATTVMYLLATNIVLLSVTLTTEMADVGTDIVRFKAENKRLFFADVNSASVMYLQQCSKGQTCWLVCACIQVYIGACIQVYMHDGAYQTAEIKSTAKTATAR